MKKRVLAILALLALCCTLFTACGSQTPAKPADSGKPSQSSQPAPSEPALPDGVYSAEFKTDSTMFHVNEVYDGKGTLTVKDGQMTIHITLSGTKIVNLFPGSAEDAQKEGAVLLQPTVDSVTYPDGLTEDAYGFDVPVPALDQEFPCALIGTKGVWYDHQVSVSNPQPVETPAD